MDELIFGKIRSISYDKYNSGDIRTFTFTVGQHIRSMSATVTRITFDELHFINTNTPRYIIFIQKDNESYEEQWKGVPAYKALIEQDLSI